MSDTDDDLPLATWRARAGRVRFARVDPAVVAEGREQAAEHDQEREEFHEAPQGEAPQPQPAAAAGFEAVAEAMARAFREALGDVRPERKKGSQYLLLVGKGMLSCSLNNSRPLPWSLAGLRSCRY